MSSPLVTPVTDVNILRLIQGEKAYLERSRNGNRKGRIGVRDAGKKEGRGGI